MRSEYVARIEMISIPIVFEMKYKDYISNLSASLMSGPLKSIVISSSAISSAILPIKLESIDFFESKYQFISYKIENVK